MSILTVNDLSLSFGGLRVLSGVSFDVNPSEILAIIGIVAIHRAEAMASVEIMKAIAKEDIGLEENRIITGMVIHKEIEVPVLIGMIIMKTRGPEGREPILMIN
jgi:ABC-type branched-subunit amino acid transport system ATPase component